MAVAGVGRKRQHDPRRHHGPHGILGGTSEMSRKEQRSLRQVLRNQDPGITGRESTRLQVGAEYIHIL